LPRRIDVVASIVTPHATDSANPKGALLNLRRLADQRVVAGDELIPRDQAQFRHLVGAALVGARAAGAETAA
jgi:hypothetical protein